MLGLRGIRLGILMPEITEMQVRAIFEAACNVASRKASWSSRGHDPAHRPRQ
jgi:phosphoenolpyruvate synthase/pyruvate phosphate dikinase